MKKSCLNLDQFKKAVVSSEDAKRPSSQKKGGDEKKSQGGKTPPPKGKHRTRSSSQKEEIKDKKPEPKTVVSTRPPGPRTKIPPKSADMAIPKVPPAHFANTRIEINASNSVVKPAVNTEKLKKEITKSKKKPQRVIGTRSRKKLEDEKQNPESNSDGTIEKRPPLDTTGMQITPYLKKKHSAKDVKKSPSKPNKTTPKKSSTKKEGVSKRKAQPSGPILAPRNSKGVVNIAPIVTQALEENKNQEKAPVATLKQGTINFGNNPQQEIINFDNHPTGIKLDLENEKAKEELKGREKDVYNTHFRKFKTMAFADNGVKSEDEEEEDDPIERRGMNLKSTRIDTKVNVLDLLSEYGDKATSAASQFHFY